MNILYVYDGPWPKGATRVRKETRAMAAAGHEITLVARNVELAPTREEEAWMTVWRLPHVPGYYLRYALNFPLFVNPLWLWTLWRAIKQTTPDRIVVCDLPLAPCAVMLGTLFGIPVHYDMAEIYPEFLRSLRQLEAQGPLERLIRSPGPAAVVERAVLKRVACTYVVSEESRMRCVALGVPNERLILVGNTPESLPALGSRRNTPSDIADLVEQDRAILLFVGILIADRGVMDAVRALPILQKTYPRAALVVVGDGPERPALEQAVKDLGLYSSVRLVGWKTPDALEDYYFACHVGLLPFRDSPHIRLTLANKLFDYMAAKLPILASDLPSTSRVLHETGAGVVHRPDDPCDLAAVANQLLNDTDGRRRMGAQGRHAVETVYSWAHDSRRLCDALHGVS